jgi:hypothetical protein
VELRAARVPSRDIEEYKDRINAYAKGLIFDGLSQFEVVETPQPNPSQSTIQVDISKRQAFLANLDIYALHSQSVGKASADFSIDSVRIVPTILCRLAFLSSTFGSSLQNYIN